MMQLVHNLLCGTKSNYTQFTLYAYEHARLSCGGHGYAHYSGIPGHFFDSAPNVTLEGDNTILLQ